MKDIITILNEKGWKVSSQDIRYIGSTFTIARASATKDYTRKDGSKVTMVKVGEGIARRSYLDMHDPELCQSIANGRALKSLYIQIVEGRKVSPLKGDHILIG